MYGIYRKRKIFRAPDCVVTSLNRSLHFSLVASIASGWALAQEFAYAALGRGFTAPLILCYHLWLGLSICGPGLASIAPLLATRLQAELSRVYEVRLRVQCDHVLPRMTSTAPRWPISPPSPSLCLGGRIQGYRNYFYSSGLASSHLVQATFFPE